MISSTHLTQPALQPQANRPVATIGRTVACDAYAPSARVQFGDNAAKPSAWERFKQGLKRLWQAVADPLKRVTAWIKKNWTPKQAEPPASSGPEQNAAPSAAETNRVTGAPPPPLLTQDSNSHPVPRGPEGAGSVALDQTTDATSGLLEESAESSAQAIKVPPSTPPETPVLPAPGTGETEEGVLCPAHEALNNARQGQDALQISGDAALAKQLAAEEARRASVSAFTSNPPEGPTTPPGGQALSIRTTPPSIPVEELFGSDLTRIQFKQKGGNTCYLLSALDAIFHHPQGKQILAKIQITRTPDGYAVKFPGQPEAVDVKAQELVTGKKNLKLANGQQVDGVKSKCLGVRILECAYSKIPNPIFGQYDESKNAMTRIFGPDHEVINIQNSRNPEKGVLRNAAGQPIAVDYVDGVRKETLLPWEGDHRIGEFEFKHDERVEQFRQYIQHARNQDELDIITAKPFNQAHYYAVRAHQSTPQTIVLADPFNTGRTIQVKFDDFMKRYDIEGVRLPR